MVDSYSAVAMKKETTYGTDSAPTLTSNAILTRNFKDTPLKVDMLSRNLDLPARGATKGVPTNKRTMFGFEVEMASSGTAGTAPRWMELLEYCGFSAPVLTATVKAEQKMAPVSAALSSASAYRWRASERRKAVGVRGDLSGINFTAGAYPYMTFDFLGLVPATTPFDSAAPGSPDFSAWKDPIEVSTTNTSVTLDGFAAVMKSLELNANVELKLRNLVGANYVQRGNHALKGKMVIEAPAQATKDYLATLSAGSVIVLAVTHGVGAGKVVKLDAANVQIFDIAESEEDEILMWTLDLQLNINAGQDDVLITAQ